MIVLSPGDTPDRPLRSYYEAKKNPVTNNEMLRKRLILRAREFPFRMPEGVKAVDYGLFQLTLELLIHMDEMSCVSTYCIDTKTTELSEDDMWEIALKHSVRMFTPAFRYPEEDLPTVADSVNNPLPDGSSRFFLYSACGHNWGAIPVLTDWKNYGSCLLDGTLFLPNLGGWYEVLPPGSEIKRAGLKFAEGKFVEVRP